MQQVKGLSAKLLFDKNLIICSSQRRTQREAGRGKLKNKISTRKTKS